MTTRETYISKQAKRLSKGQIDRRRFVMSALATGVTMPTALSLASRAEGAVPKSGGHLRYGAASKVVLDRSLGVLPVSDLKLALGDTLIELDHRRDPIGGLADSFAANDAGTTWVFDLRAGVTFHSGKTLSADDVLASLASAAKDSAAARGITGLIQKAHPDGQARVVLHLHRPHQNFAALLANPDLIIRPAVGDAFDGTGAYRLQHLDPGISIKLERNQEDWRSRRGHFDSIDVRAMPDAAQRQSAIMNGEVDIIEDVDPRALAMLSNIPNLGLYEVPNARHIHFQMRLDRGPFGDPHIRAALKAAVDRHALRDEALLGHGAVGHDAPWKFDADTALFDADKARWHVAVAGQTGPIVLALPKQNFPSADIVAHLVAQAAGDIGLDVRLFNGDQDSEWHLRMARSALCGDASLVEQSLSDTGSCEIGWATPEAELQFANQLQSARTIKDPNARDAGLEQASGMLARDGGLLLPLWANDIYAHSTALAHSDASLAGQSNLASILKGWWFS